MKLRYDGHGLNDGNDKYARRVITWARTSADNGSGYVLNLNERADLGPQLAAAPELLAALESAVLALDDSAIRGPSSGATESMRAAIAKAKGEA